MIANLVLAAIAAYACGWYGCRIFHAVRSRRTLVVNVSQLEELARIARHERFELLLEREAKRSVGAN